MFRLHENPNQNLIHHASGEVRKGQNVKVLNHARCRECSVTFATMIFVRPVILNARLADNVRTVPTRSSYASCHPYISDHQNDALEGLSIGKRN